MTGDSGKNIDFKTKLGDLTLSQYPIEDNDILHPYGRILMDDFKTNRS